MLKNFLKNKVVSNSIYLYILQIFNTVLPLVILPFVTRVLGIEQYGVFSKMLNYITYFQTFIEYGFTLTGAKKISLAKSQEEINKTFSCILICKLILCTVSLTIILFLGFFVFYSNSQWKCLFILSIILLSEVFMQTWVLQGLQDMKFIMIVSVVARTISTILIFVFVKTPNDILLYALLYSLTNLIVGAFGTCIVGYKFKIKFYKYTIKEYVKEFLDGFSLFITSFASRVCVGISVTVLSIFSTDVNIGGFSAMQKIPYIVVMMYMPISQALYPYICKLYKENITKGIQLIKKFLIVITICCILGSVFLIALRNGIVSFVYGEEYIEYSKLIIPLCAWLCFSIINNILGVQILVARGYQKEYSIIFMISVLILISLNFGLGYVWDIYGVSIATMIGELAVTFGCIIVVLKRKLLSKKQIDIELKNI